MAMGCHHDNFDCYDSQYQPWNSVLVGPQSRHRRHLGKGSAQARTPFRHRFSRLSGPNLGAVHGRLRYASDKAGPMKGCPTMRFKQSWTETGKWWQGMDPADLYGPVHDDKDPLHSPFANSSCGGWMTLSQNIIPT